MSTVAIRPVDRGAITILMDDITDPLLVDQPAVHVNWPRALLGRSPPPPRVSPDSGVPDALIAAPGYHASVPAGPLKGPTRSLVIQPP